MQPHSYNSSSSSSSLFNKDSAVFPPSRGKEEEETKKTHDFQGLLRSPEPRGRPRRSESVNKMLRAKEKERRARHFSANGRGSPESETNSSSPQDNIRSERVTRLLEYFASKDSGETSPMAEAYASVSRRRMLGSWDALGGRNPSTDHPKATTTTSKATTKGGIQRYGSHSLSPTSSHSSESSTSAAGTSRYAARPYPVSSSSAEQLRAEPRAVQKALSPPPIPSHKGETHTHLSPRTAAFAERYKTGSPGAVSPPKHLSHHSPRSPVYGGNYDTQRASQQGMIRELSDKVEQLQARLTELSVGEKTRARHARSPDVYDTERSEEPDLEYKLSVTESARKEQEHRDRVLIEDMQKTIQSLREKCESCERARRDERAENQALNRLTAHRVETMYKRIDEVLPVETMSAADTSPAPEKESSAHERLENGLRTLDKKVKLISQELNTQCRENKGLQQQIEELRTELYSTENGLQDKTALVTANGGRREPEKGIKDQHAENENLRKQIDEAQKELSESNSRLQEARREAEQHRQVSDERLQELSEDAARVKQENQKLRQEVEGVRQTHGEESGRETELKQRVEELESELARRTNKWESWKLLGYRTTDSCRQVAATLKHTLFDLRNDCKCDFENILKLLGDCRVPLDRLVEQNKRLGSSDNNELKESAGAQQKYTALPALQSGMEISPPQVYVNDDWKNEARQTCWLLLDLFEDVRQQEDDARTTSALQGVQERLFKCVQDQQQLVIQTKRIIAGKNARLEQLEHRMRTSDKELEDVRASLYRISEVSGEASLKSEVETVIQKFQEMKENLNASREAVSAKEEELREYSDQLKAERTTVCDMQEYNDSLRETVRKLESKLEDMRNTAEEERRKLMEQLDDKEVHINALKTKLEDTTSSLKEESKKLTSAHASIHCIRSKVYRTSDELAEGYQDVAVQLCNLQQKLQRLENRQGDASALMLHSFRDARGQTKKKEEQLRSKQTVVTQLETEKEELIAERSESKEKMKELQELNSEQEQKLSDLTDQRSTLEARIEELQESVSDKTHMLEEERAQLRSELLQERSEKENARSDVQTMSKKIEELETSNAELREENEKAVSDHKTAMGELETARLSKRKLQEALGIEPENMAEDQYGEETAERADSGTPPARLGTFGSVRTPSQSAETAESDDIAQRVVTLKQDLQELRQTKQQLETEKEDSARQVRETTDKVEELDRRIKEMTERNKSLEDKCRTIEVREHELTERNDKLSKELAEVKQHVTKSEEENKILNRKLEISKSSLSSQKESYKAKINELENELEQLKSRDLNQKQKDERLEQLISELNEEKREKSQKEKDCEDLEGRLRQVNQQRQKQMRSCSERASQLKTELRMVKTKNSDLLQLMNAISTQEQRHFTHLRKCLDPSMRHFVEVFPVLNTIDAGVDTMGKKIDSCSSCLNDVSAKFSEKVNGLRKKLDRQKKLNESYFDSSNRVTVLEEENLSLQETIKTKNNNIEELQREIQQLQDKDQALQVLKERNESIERELEEYRTKLEEKDNAMRDIQNEKAQLEASNNEHVEEIARVKEEAADKDSSHERSMDEVRAEYSAEIKSLQESNHSKNQHIEQLQSEVENLSKEVENLKSVNQQLEEEQSTLEQKIRDEESNHEQRLAALQQQAEQAEHQNAQTSELQQSVAQLRNENSDLQSYNASLEKRLEETEKAKKKAEEDLEQEADESRQHFENKMLTLRSSLLSLQNEAQSVHDEVEQIAVEQRRILAQMRSELEDNDQALIGDTDRLCSWMKKYEQMVGKLTASQQTVHDQLSQEKQQHQARISELEQELYEIKEVNTRMEEELRNEKNTLAEKDDQIATLQNQIENLKDNASTSESKIQESNELLSNEVSTLKQELLALHNSLQRAKACRENMYSRVQAFQSTEKQEAHAVSQSVQELQELYIDDTTRVQGLLNTLTGLLKQKGDADKEENERLRESSAKYYNECRSLKQQLQELKDGQEVEEHGYSKLRERLEEKDEELGQYEAFVHSFAKQLQAMVQDSSFSIVENEQKLDSQLAKLNAAKITVDSLRGKPLRIKTRKAATSAASPQLASPERPILRGFGHSAEGSEERKTFPPESVHRGRHEAEAIEEAPPKKEDSLGAPVAEEVESKHAEQLPHTEEEAGEGFAEVSLSGEEEEEELSEDVMEFMLMLLHGFRFLKYASGILSKPHERVFWLDVSGNYLFFRWGVPGDHSFNDDRTVTLDEITEITKGRATKTLQKKGKLEKDPQYLSIVTRDRTLDMELADEAQRDWIHKNLKDIIETPGLLQDALMALFHSGRFQPGQ
eukprot:gb/GECG01001685.1/.p1 GENE.gb/GECG01001685.1/~~gb/GECG01001685.1/.p1  ORF type:complete len:2307 (+),score=521.23 gb/GECG01001685.1/:1-6921(+)